MCTRVTDLRKCIFLRVIENTVSHFMHIDSQNVVHQVVLSSCFQNSEASGSYLNVFFNYISNMYFRFLEINPGFAIGYYNLTLYKY